MVNTVHDSIVIDVHPSEEDVVLNIIRDTNKSLINMINLELSIQFDVPLLLEAKMGSNWLDTKDVS